MDAFGPYDVIEQIAAGSTGTVYRARHRDLGRIVAVKELSPQLRAVPGMLERFRGEARVLAGLNDPHIVSVYDYVEEPDRAWIAEEWVTGASLHTLMTARGRFSPEQALGALRGALQGLAYAHAHGVVHRDVSSQNVLADLAGESRVVDFGLAAPVGGTEVCGTPAFMSPEAASGRPVGTASDVYSAAAVLFLLITGKAVFAAASVPEVLRRHREVTAPALPGQGPDLADLIARCLAKDAAARPPDAAAMLAELEQATARRYGADWLTRAGIAGLVALTVRAEPGAPAEQPTGSGSMDTGAAPPAELAPAPIAVPVPLPVAPPVHHRRKRVRRASPIVVAAAAVVVLGAAATAVTLADHPSPETAASAQTPAPTPTPTPTPSVAVTVPPTPAPLAAAEAPQGAFAYRIVFLTSDNPRDKVGDVLTGVWTIVTTCAATPCTGTITSTGGARYTTTWDGTTLVATGSRLSPCLSDATGALVPGGTGAYAESIVNTLTVVRRSATGQPQALQGSATEMQRRIRPVANCSTKITHETRSVTAVRQ